MNEKTPAELGLEAALRLKDISYARSRLEFWRERYSFAASKIESWEKEIKRVEAFSEGKTFGPVPYENY